MLDHKALNLVRSIALVGLLATVLVLGGCSSCKDFELQIDHLNAQVGALQQDIADREAKITEGDQIAEELRGDLKDCQAEKAVLIEKSEEVVMVTIPDQIIFPSGQVTVDGAMVPVLQAIASAVRDRPDWDVYVEAYTDDPAVPEEDQEYWPPDGGLGAFRAAAVGRYLTNDLGLDPARFAAVSYAGYRPVVSNDTPEGRAQNRLVRVVMHKPGM